MSTLRHSYLWVAKMALACFCQDLLTQHIAQAVCKLAAAVSGSNEDQ